jgi:hypothetical protein
LIKIEKGKIELTKLGRQVAEKIPKTLLWKIPRPLLLSIA